MGWLIRSLVACYTASLVVGDDEALLNPQTDARTSNIYNTHARFPIFPRRELCFRNDTGVSEKLVYTTCTSAVLTDSAVVTPTETELASTSTSKEHNFSSKFSSPESLSATLLELSSNVPSTSLGLDSSGVVSRGTTKMSIASPITPIFATASARVWESEEVHPDVSRVASSINPSRTASSLSATPEPEPSLGVSLVSTLLQDVASSQTAGAQLPIITATLVDSLSDSLITDLLSTTYGEAPQKWDQSTVSSAVLYPTTIQNAEFSALESTYALSFTAVVSGQQKQHIDPPSETSSASSNLGTALSILSNASKTANGLQQHLVSSLASWSPLISSTAGTSRGNGPEVATVTATTLTKTIPQQTVSASEVVENYFTSTTPAPNSTFSSYLLFTIHSEDSAANAPWLSTVFTWASSQATILSTLILSANSTIPTTSSNYTNSNFSGAVPTTSQTATSQSVTSSTLGPYTTSVQGNSSFLPSGTHSTPSSSNDGIFSRARSDSFPQMTQTRLQPASISVPFMPVSLMLTPIQTPTPAITVEIADAQYPSSGIFPTTSFPCPSISTPFVGWTNTSAPKPPEESAAFNQPTISSSLKANSSTNPLVLGYMSQTSSLSPTGTSPPVSKYMDISSFVTRTRTSSSEPPSQTILAASDVNTTLTASPSTTLLPIHSPTETVTATSSPPLTTSEAAGVAIGSTAGLLLAIVAIVFVARRYHTARSAKQGSNGSSGVYPRLAYLYDPSLGRGESDNGGDDRASTFMSGGATGQPLTPTNRKPPAPPHNSVDFGYGRLYNFDARYSDPGNPFTDIEDPFLEWRSSDAISTPSDTRFALAAAVARYSNGPQKPLPPLPHSVSIHAFRDHIIPSPTLSPITNGYGLQRSLVKSSSRSSVQSQKSLRKFYCSSSSHSSSRDYGKIQRQSLTSIHEADSHHRVSDLMEHDLLLPVDTRSETSDSVVVYASTLTSKSLTKHSIPASFGKSTISMSLREDTPHPNTQANYSTQPPHSSGPSPTNPTCTEISYADFPSPPASICTPIHKGWDEIKRMSTDYTVLMSPLSPLSPSSFSPTFPSPPPPLKKRSLINIGQKTRLSDVSTASQPRGLRGHRSVPAPLRIRARFEEGERKGFEAKRMSLLENVQSLGDLRGET